MSDSSLGARLRYERERRQIALKSIADATRSASVCSKGLNVTMCRAGRPASFESPSFVPTPKRSGWIPIPSCVNSSNGTQIRSKSTLLHRPLPLHHRHRRVPCVSNSPSPGADRCITPLEDWRTGRLSECCSIDDWSVTRNPQTTSQRPDTTRSIHQSAVFQCRAGTSHHWKIGGLEDCQNVVELKMGDWARCITPLEDWRVGRLSESSI